MEFLSESNAIRKLYLPIQWLILPMFYLHVHEVIFRKHISFPTSLYLFTPVAFVFVLHLVHFFFNYGIMPIAEMPDYYAPGLLLYINGISFLFNAIVGYHIYKMLKTNAPATKTGKKKNPEQEWYMSFLALVAGIGIIGVSITISLIQFDIDHTWLIYTLFLMVSTAGYYMGYVGVYRSTLWGEPKNSFSTVSKNGANTYRKIHSYIIEEQRYLDMDLNQSEIAEKFNISPGYLSQLINTNSDQNFNDYINTLRIEASKEMLVAEQFKNYTIESIGLECGFKSKSNFYAAFKKFTGQTPSSYIKVQKMSPVS
ncbi:AraC family transcriptional regulator [Maribacter algarum]|uniref:AraC family transcriptional regulator n=1 Tax=Maribacter algarum (ex Zhang et al. 2020) TaxID=2578118 RepID=A0A5S3PVE5_9FLAO|nr:helix-turn-helix domain-containing protein [Maribacter algarum]TMM58878.1 AraC family transcriptional regulator [Maribacter algarum]